MLDDFVETKRGGICGTMGDRYINSKSNSIRSIWYIDANKLYGYAMMQKLHYRDLEHITMAEHDRRSINRDNGDTKLRHILNR